MGYLDNTTVTVDAILTNKGRQVLAQGGQLNITKFALADDEVDYGLWNPAHSLGSNYYGAVIENMPILEASPDETQMLRYKLVTLPKTTLAIPVVTIAGGPITFTRVNVSATITASTPNVSNGNATLGYTAILSDDTVATIEADQSVVETQGQSARLGSQGATVDLTTTTFSDFLPDNVGTYTTTGGTIIVTSLNGKFIVRPRAVTGTQTALITIIANETGGFQTTTVTCTNTVSTDYVDAGAAPGF